MTQAEFNEAQRRSRDEYRANFRKTNRQIAALYKRAADEIAEKIKTLTQKGKGDSLTVASQKKLEASLRITGARIAGQTEIKIIDGINYSITKTNNPHLQYLKSAIKDSGISKINFRVIETMYSQLNETFIDLTYSRIWQDGYTFSDRIWGYPGTETQPYLPGLGGYWQNNMKDLVTMGFMQGRDVLQIAKDLSVYAVHGKKGVMKRYGDLVRGTKTFSQRVPANIDWRALRLARSELYISLQDTAKMQGRMNPAVMSYIWNLTAGSIHVCRCPDLAADSPYPEGEVPDFPHPNCLCYITVKLRSRKDFIEDLQNWESVNIPYLDNWYQESYLPVLN